MVVAAVIRKATIDDMHQIIPLAVKFNDTYYKTPLDMVKAIMVMTYCIEEGVAFISGTGFIGGCIVDDLLRDRTILQEVAWYSEGRDGVALLDAFIKEGHELGVDETRASTLATSSPIVGRILQRRGFVPLETSYRLEMSAWPQSPQSLPSPE